MNRKSINIDGYEIGEKNQTYIVAEIGINHGGDLDKAIKLIDEAKSAGANAVKMQSYLTEKRVAVDSPLFKILKDSELSFDQQEKCIKHGKNNGITIFSTPFDDESVDFLESVNCPAYKIASFDTVNHSLLRKVASTKKPVIMSTGMTNVKELGDAWKSLGGKDDGSGCELALLHCISSYPTPSKEANLSLINLLKTYHSGPVGYSDHTIGVEIPVMAVASGAKIIEKHFTLDKTAGGLDDIFSMDPDDFNLLVKEAKNAWLSLGKVYYGLTQSEQRHKNFKRSIYVKKDIKKGELFSEKNLKVIRPSYGLEPKYYKKILGKVAKRNLNHATPLKKKDISS